MTKLSAINYMLSTVNIQPIADLNEALDELTLASRALAILNSERRLALTTGYPFNTTEQTLPKNAADNVPIPSDVIRVSPVEHGVHAVIRGGLLYNMANNSFVWADGNTECGTLGVDGVPKLEIIWDRPEDNDIPVEFSEFVLANAAHRFASLNGATQDTIQACLLQIVKAKEALMRWIADNIKANINDPATQHQLLSRKYNPMRRW